MLEAVSIHSLISRPMFRGASWMLTHHTWTREHDVGLALLCKYKINAEKAADSLGRPPTSLAWRAQRTGLILPPDWRDLIRSRSSSSGPTIQLQYPYIQEVRGEHADLLAVNALVPRGFPDHMRADICQEIMLALWQKEVCLQELQTAPKLIGKYITRVKKSNYEGGGFALSLDMPMRDGRNWYEVLPDEAEPYEESELEDA